MKHYPGNGAENRCNSFMCALACLFSSTCIYDLYIYVLKRQRKDAMCGVHSQHRVSLAASTNRRYNENKTSTKSRSVAKKYDQLATELRNAAFVRNSCCNSWITQ